MLLEKEMNFNSLIFAAFFALFFIIYWAAFRKRLAMQNIWLLAGSLTFYGWWDWRFLGLLLAVIAVSYVAALRSVKSHAKSWITAGVTVNLLILAFFKYFNFFGENLARLFAMFGSGIDWFTLEVILPVGISFYTFQAMSYLVDVYKQRVKPERDFVRFAVFLSYFPQLVAGPIERASALLPQIGSLRRWNYPEIVLGLRQTLWGLVKKVVVADACGYYVDEFFYYKHTGGMVAATLAVILFSIQIYCDFSGYCDIARGISRCLGIELMQNFRYPYFAKNIREYWHRWNASLMMWLRDYVYFPLGGSRCRERRVMLNIVLVFLVSGIWHGSAWTFILWGLFWGIVMVGYRLFKKHTSVDLGAWNWPLTMGFAVLSRAIFRSFSVTQAVQVMVETIPSIALLVAAWGAWLALPKSYRRWLWYIAAAAVLVFACVATAETIQFVMREYVWIAAAGVFAVEWHWRDCEYPMQRFAAPGWARMAVYMLLVMLLLTNQYDEVPFIYFQF